MAAGGTDGTDGPSSTSAASICLPSDAHPIGLGGQGARGGEVEPKREQAGEDLGGCRAGGQVAGADGGGGGEFDCGGPGRPGARSCHCLCGGARGAASRSAGGRSHARCQPSPTKCTKPASILARDGVRMACRRRARSTHAQKDACRVCFRVPQAAAAAHVSVGSAPPSPNRARSSAPRPIQRVTLPNLERRDPGEGLDAALASSSGYALRKPPLRRADSPRSQIGHP